MSWIAHAFKCTTSVSTLGALHTLVDVPALTPGTIKAWSIRTGSVSITGDWYFGTLKNGTDIFTTTERIQITAGSTWVHNTTVSEAVTEYDILQPNIVAKGTGTISGPIYIVYWIEPTAKTTPVDADSVRITDSAAANKSKGLSWANVKATLLTYFNTIYVPLARTVNSKALSANITLGLASADFANQGTTTTVLHGNAAGNPAFGAVVEADITLADNATNNVSTAKHGFAPKGDGDTAKFLNADGAYSTPAGGGSVATDAIFDAKGDLAGGTGADTAARLPVGANGTILSADSAETTGLKWISAPGGGDLIAANNLSDVANAGTSRTNLGVGTGNSPEFTGVNVGHASDTTVTRSAAGDIAVEGNRVFRVGGSMVGMPVEIGVACSDETTAITTGTAKATFRMPYAMTVTAVRASVTTAPTGATLIVDINDSGTTILSTKLSIDISEKTSTTAASVAVISDSALADDAEITIDFDQVGSTIAGAGVKVWLIGTRA